MKIGWIGGVERNEPLLHRIAEADGHTLELHGGDVGGRGVLTLHALVERCDIVLIVTDVNSHGAVQLAKKLCRRHGKASLVVRNCGPARFRQLIEAMHTRDVRQLAAG